MMMRDWRDDYPKAIRPNEMLKRFENLSARVVNDCKPVVVESNAGDVVLMSAAEYRSIMETMHVFSSPANGQSVNDGLEQARRGRSSGDRYPKRDDS
ncbi:type II toxin-antitoxin system Phd/YefM family antitoxin [Rhodococcus sp. NPDC057297]|uniref:type II toxin-antitoxin system Phd/YefM family antitoxin n=1 Tax=Rhodococcus sp. NPDC057297 TaxID=3346090 RepID=UPI0036288C33